MVGDKSASSRLRVRKHVTAGEGGRGPRTKQPTKILEPHEKSTRLLA